MLTRWRYVMNCWRRCFELQPGKQTLEGGVLEGEVHARAKVRVRVGESEI